MPCQPLTKENLEKALHSFEPVCENEPSVAAVHRAKRCVREFLQSLEGIGAVGERILQSESLYIDNGNNVRLRGEDDLSPHSCDAAFWESSLRRLEKQYGSILTIERVKGSVFAVMSALSQENRQILEQDELYIAGQNDVRQRGNDVEHDLGDVEYWERKYTYFEEQLFQARQRKGTARTVLGAAMPREESPCEPQSPPRYGRDLGRNNTSIAAWAAAHPAGMQQSPSNKGLSLTQYRFAPARASKTWLHGR